MESNADGKKTPLYKMLIFAFGILTIISLYFFVKKYYVEHLFDGYMVSAFVLSAMIYLFVKSESDLFA